MYYIFDNERPIYVQLVEKLRKELAEEKVNNYITRLQNPDETEEHLC